MSNTQQWFEVGAITVKYVYKFSDWAAENNFFFAFNYTKAANLLQ